MGDSTSSDGRSFAPDSLLFGDGRGEGGGSAVGMTLNYLDVTPVCAVSDLCLKLRWK